MLFVKQKINKLNKNNDNITNINITDSLYYYI